MVAHAGQHSVEVAAGSSWLRWSVRQIFEPTQQSLLITSHSLELLRELQVFCAAAAHSLVDAVLDCPECAPLLRAAIGAIATYRRGGREVRQPCISATIDHASPNMNM